MSISASCDKSSDFGLHKFNSVDAKICDIVPNLWNNIAVNCMIRINAKKNTKTNPMGSSCKYSFEIWTCEYDKTHYYSHEYFIELEMLGV